MSVLALIATIPARRRSCERLLDELTRQTRVPDGVILVLDGYSGDDLRCALPVAAKQQNNVKSGAGQRWLFAAKLPADDIIVCLDDDIRIAQSPNCIKALVEAVESGGGAAAAMGFDSVEYKRAPPMDFSRGDLIYAAGCGLALRPRHLAGLGAFADEVKAAGGPDALGLLGDDDALVSAYLWKTGVRVVHAATGNIFPAPNTQSSSQTFAKQARRVDPNAQKIAIGRITGWPFPLKPGAARAPQRRVVR